MRHFVKYSHRFLAKSQNKIVRIITYSPYLAHTEPLFKELNILTLQKLVIQRIGLQMFNYSKNNLPLAVSELFTTNDAIHSHKTRNKLRLRCKVSKHEYIIGVHIWNAIQEKIIVSTSYSIFKNALKICLQCNDLNFRLA